ncbi:hypothetical protein [Luteolibacter sp. Populi]|uniref:hypothetical protein n=1 Tax=Luteolibacter sp. Populi TaxID=3230487 RepID=UPI003465C922
MKTLLLLPLAAASVSGSEGLKTADLKKLADPAVRQAEVGRLAECDGKDRFLKNFRLHTALQKDGAAPLQVLSADTTYRLWDNLRSIFGGYEIEKPEELFGGSGQDGVKGLLTPELSRITSGALLVLGPDGKEIRPFGGNNLISGGYLFDFDHDGILDRADSTYHEVKRTEEMEVQVFTLETVERVPRCLLRVIYNWHPDKADHANDWSFACTDGDGDGIVEISFGPDSVDYEIEEPVFTFRYDPATKTYTAGEIPKHSHIRVLKEGERLEEIAKGGGLGYPVIDPEKKADEKAPLPDPPLKTYVFQSLKEASDQEVAAFFHGKASKDRLGDPDDAMPNQMPGGFWTMAPKEAALALVEANRSKAHRRDWRIAVDDRHGIAPPGSGWWILDAGSSGCYSFSAQLFALRFGTEQAWLMATDYNNNGVVGRNPLADQPGYTARVIPLSQAEARFLAETLFWLDRIRSYSILDEDYRGSMRSSTADGGAELDLLVNGRPVQGTGYQTVWSDFLSARWEGEYDREACINFASQVLRGALPEHLGERWRVAPEIDRRSLATPLEDRLAPRLGEDARQQLAGNLRTAFARHWADPLPPPALAKLVISAGEEALAELRPELERLRESLPEVNAEDKEFEALEKRFGFDAMRNNTPGESEEELKDKARHEKLEKKRRFMPGPVLREPVADALRKLDIAGNAKRLEKAADANDAMSRWALDRLRKSFPEVWQDYLIVRFREGNREERRNLLSTLGAARPEGGQSLVDLMSPAEIAESLIEVAGFEAKADPERARTRVAGLLEMIRKREAGFIRRAGAMKLLLRIALDEKQAAQAASLLLKEIKNPQKGDYDMDTFSTAVDTLSKLPGAAAHLDAIQAVVGDHGRDFRASLAVLERLTRGRADRLERLEAYLKPCLEAHPGVMNDVFFAALALDLHGLAPAIATCASESPAVRDGDGADYWGGNFKGPKGEHYHAAREVTALWQEKDAETLARTWIAFAASRAYCFGLEGRDNAVGEALRAKAAAAVAKAAPERRAKMVKVATEAVPAGYLREAAVKVLEGVAGP